MGSSDQRSYRQIIYVLIFSSLLLLNIVYGLNDPEESLDTLLHDYANKTVSNHRTGSLYEVSLPSNLSGMNVLVVSLRSSSFWARGADFRCFHIPRRVIPMPYVKRLAIVYDNLGNWSSYYFQPPEGYSFVAPVVGFSAYDASNIALGKNKLTFSIIGDPISVNFTTIIKLQDNNNNNVTVTPQCVTFSGNGSEVELTNMTKPNVCISTGSGHFSVIVPSPATTTATTKKDHRVLGFAIGSVGLALLVVIVVVVFIQAKKNRIKQMEKESEKGVALDEIYIGTSRMPTTSMIRTRPVIEHDFLP